MVCHLFQQQRCLDKNLLTLAVKLLKHVLNNTVFTLNVIFLHFILTFFLTKRERLQLSDSDSKNTAEQSPGIKITRIYKLQI